MREALWHDFNYLALISALIEATGWDLNYILGHYQRFCALRGDTCILCDAGPPISCRYMRPRLIGLTAHILNILTYVILYFKYEPLVVSKADLAEIVGRALSKDGGRIRIDNQYQGAVSKVLERYYDYVIKEDLTKELQEILMIKNPAERQLRMKEFVEEVFTRIEDDELRRILLKLTGEKSALNIARLIQVFPNHRPIEDDPDIRAVVKRKAKRFEMSGRTDPNYILDEWDMDRFKAYEEGGLKRLIALQGSYFYLYKKHRIEDPDFWLLLELEETLDERSPKSETEIQVIEELKDLIKRRYKIDLDTEAREIMEIYHRAVEEEEKKVQEGDIEIPIS